MKVIALAFGAVIALTFVACGGNGGSGETPEVSAEERQQIESTLTAFVTALGNADTEVLDDLWSQTCSQRDRRGAVSVWRDQAKVVTDRLGDGAYQLTLGPTPLQIDGEADDRVIIPVEQPDGAVTAKLGNTILPAGTELIFQVPIALAKEDGAWKVATCQIYA